MNTAPDLRIAAVAAQQYGVFSASQAAGLGFSRDAMHHRVRTGRWGRMHRGVYRLAGSPPSWEQSLMAAWLAGGIGAAVSHATAGRLHTYPLKSGQIELSIGAHARRQRRGIKFHRASELTFADLAAVGPFTATSPTRTLIDL